MRLMSSRRCGSAGREFQGQGQRDDEINATIVLTEALLSQKKYAEAKKEIESTTPLLQKNQNKLLQLQVRLAAARVELALGHLDVAGKEIQAVRAEATATGLRGIRIRDALGAGRRGWKPPGNQRSPKSS